MRPIVNIPEEDRATYIGNMHKTLVNIACVILEISSRTDDRQTYSSQYFATAPEGEVIKKTIVQNRVPNAILNLSSCQLGLGLALWLSIAFGFE